MVSPLLAIEVHDVARAFTLRARLSDFESEVVPGYGDIWHVRVVSDESGAEIQAALARVREWLLEEELSAAIVRIAGAREVITPDS